MKIFFSGGGTLGSVTPLLGIRDAFRESYPDVEYVWVGTKDGPERIMLEHESVRYIPIGAGKFRRYISVKNLVDVFRIIHAFFSSLLLLRRERPDLCVSAGAFVSVPLHWAAWCLKIPTWIHQQDVRPGLANRLMARCATVITTAFDSQTHFFAQEKTKFLGNPIRLGLLQGNKSQAAKLFHLRAGYPVVFVLGGGTGAARVNDLLLEALPFFADSYDIIHLYGKDRPSGAIEQAQKNFHTYHPYPFLQDEMRHAYAAADLVIGRAGLGTLTELAALSKPVILIPKEGHQEENAQALERSDAVIALNETDVTGELLATHIQTLLASQDRRYELGRNLHNCIRVPSTPDILKIYQTCIP